MNLTIRLLKHSNLEDSILIRKRMNGTFLISYIDGNIPNNAWASAKKDDELMLFLERVIYFFKNDVNTFEEIEVSIPGQPVIHMAKINCNDDFISNVMTSIEDFVYKPPSRFTR